MRAQRISWILASTAIVILSGGGSTSADFVFGARVDLRSAIPVIDPALDILDCFSADGLEMYISSWQRNGENGHFDLFVSRRDSVDEDWGPSESLGQAVNTLNHDEIACISGDGLTLYFCSDRPGGCGGWDIWATTRPTRNDAWGPAENLGLGINSATTAGALSGADGEPWISPNGLELYFESYRPGGYGRADIYVARRATQNDPWEEPVNLGPVVNSQYGEQFLCLSPDRLVLFFCDHMDTSLPRPGGLGGPDIWMSRRASLSDPWQAPVNPGSPINSSIVDTVPRLSPDGCTLYFATYDGTTWEYWQAPILPIVDFNGDGNANGKDVIVLAQHWGESDSVCDIGPYAWGDGIVDEQDLFMLAEYLEKEFVDPTLVAHWALDETEGIVAADSAGGNDAMVMGDPAWQPEGGSVGGALAFDGVDDCIVTDPVAELSAGSFSILAWVKGGAADEVILSRGTADWLYTNPADGSLMTAISSRVGNGVPLFSDTVITDGQWHRIGLLWDGTSRILIVDEQEVARDKQAELAISDDSLMIGTGPTPGRFFSGQIDDIRIYNRVVKP